METAPASPQPAIVTAVVAVVPAIAAIAAIAVVPFLLTRTHIPHAAHCASHGRYNKFVGEIAEFRATDGTTLQRYLYLRSWLVGNYVSDWWVGGSRGAWRRGYDW